MYVLGYDIGSSSVKASLVNVESGKCAASAFFPKTEAPILAVKLFTQFDFDFGGLYDEKS